jgi:hypothetical protein
MTGATDPGALRPARPSPIRQLHSSGRIDFVPLAQRSSFKPTTVHEFWVARLHLFELLAGQPPLQIDSGRSRSWQFPGVGTQTQSVFSLHGAPVSSHEPVWQKPLSASNVPPLLKQSIASTQSTVSPSTEADVEPPAQASLQAA